MQFLLCRYKDQSFDVVSGIIVVSCVIHTVTVGLRLRNGCTVSAVFYCFSTLTAPLDW